MVTVGIVDENGEFRKMASRLFRRLGIRTANSLTNSGADFVFLSPKEGKHYDILVESGTGSGCACHADYIHIISAESAGQEPAVKPTFFITYGLDSTATVTASSISQEEGLAFQYCLQRNIVSLKGKKIECQEFPVQMSSGTELYPALALVTLALVCSIPKEALAHI